MGDLKKDPYEKICVNGRVPAIEDPNTGVTLWESGAIIEYLAETYDTKHALSFGSSPEKYYVKQWLHFQMSGQGPYFGQAAWFAKFHSEQIESAKDRYFDQVKRVYSVLDKALQGKQYLVGDKWYVENKSEFLRTELTHSSTIADLSFITWDMMIPWIFGDRSGELDFEKNYPAYFAWNQRLMARPAVKKVIADKQAVNAAH